MHPPPVRLIASTLMICSVVAACSPGAPFSPNGPVVPASWKQAGAFPVASPDKDLSRWWGRFNDATLNRLIADGLRNSPDLAAARARVREARARRDAQSASLLPFIGASTSTSNRRTRTDQAGTVSSSSYSAGLDASWEVDLFGKQRSTVEAATANLGVASENVHSVRASLAAEIASAYTNLRANEARMVVLRRNISTREQTAQLASWRLKAGETDSLEANQAQSSLETAHAGVPALEQAISQGRNDLARLCGLNPGSLDPVLTGKNKGVPSPPASLSVGIPADTLRQRPDVRVAGYQVLAADAATRAADAARYPSLNLSGTLGASSLSAGNIFSPETLSAGIASGLSAPVFDGGRLRANLEAAKAVRDQAFENYRSTVLTALSETENALIACRRSAERLTSLEKATALAREADLLARQRYQAGEIDFSDVLDTQRSVLALEESLLGTRTDRTTAYIRLYQALGGGWSRP